MQQPCFSGAALGLFASRPCSRVWAWRAVVPWMAGLTAAWAVGWATAAEAPLIGWGVLGRPDRLAEFKPAIEVGCVSSYDRTGGNDDGFSGKYSFVRKEGDASVIADLQGPGEIYRIWTPTPTDDPLEFYFDGEAQPRIRVPFREMFSGKAAPFVKPFVGHGVGGFFSYVPLPYAKSCKVVVRAERVQFYQINFARYTPEAGIESFRSEPDAATARLVRRAGDFLASSGRDVVPFIVPPGAVTRTFLRRASVQGHARALLCEIGEPGRIVGLRLRPVEALADKGRDLVLRIAFDGDQAQVLCPLGDFFGHAWGEAAMRSVFVGTTAREAYCYFPMPFDRSARIELVSERRDSDRVECEAEVVFAAAPRQAGEGRFGAVWRRENPTTTGQPFTFIEAHGRGHLVGFVLQAQGFESGRTLFFEGDDSTWIDGRLAVQGTGSEDFFNGGWYDVPDRWEKRLSLPLSGCLGYQKHLGRTGGYRLLMGDAYSYREGVRQTIEHSGAGNDIPTDYAAVTFLYADPAFEATLLPTQERAVVDLKELVFPAWWQIPIRAFPFDGTTLSRKTTRLGTEDVRYLSVAGGEPDWVGPAYLYVTCHVPVAGRYAVGIDALRGPGQGRVQLFQDEVPAGEAVDLYAEAPVKSARLDLGVLELEAGDNPVMLKLVGRNERSSGLGLDLIQVVCRRIP